MTERVEARSQGHLVQFLNCQLRPPSPRSNLDNTGLIGEGLEYPELHTGVWSGPVGVTVDSRSSRPSEVDMSWEDIAEFSVSVDEGPLVLCGMWEIPIQGWPRLDGFGAGTYRIRVHARGRDVAYDMPVSEATEEYLVVSWPEEESPALLIASGSSANESWIGSAKRRCAQSFVGGAHAGTFPASPVPASDQDPTHSSGREGRLNRSGWYRQSQLRRVWRVQLARGARRRWRRVA